MPAGATSLMMLKMCTLPLAVFKKAGSAGSPPSLGRSRTLVHNLVPSLGEAGGKAKHQRSPPHPGCGVPSRLATSSTGRDPDLPGQGLSHLHIALSPTQAPGPKVCLLGHPPTPLMPPSLLAGTATQVWKMRYQRRAPGNPSRSPAGPPTRRCPIYQRTEPTWQAQGHRKSCYPRQRSPGAGEPETPPAHQSPAHVQGSPPISGRRHKLM